MKKIVEYIWIEFKMQFRIPVAMFFTIFFPILLLTVFAISTKNYQIYEDIHFVDVYLPVMILLILFSSGITSFSIIVAGNRSEKMWQLYRLRGFKLYQIILAQLFINILISFISMIILIIYAALIFNANVPSLSNLTIFMLIWILIAITMFLIGFVIGVFCRNEKIAQSTSTPIMFILMFLSGIMVEYSAFPKSIQKLVLYLPTTQANKILVQSWNNFTNGDNLINWYVIIVWIIISFIIVLWKLYKDDFKRI